MTISLQCTYSVPAQVTRSCPQCKFRLTVGAGVIDCDYRGIVYVLLFNLGERELEISIGDHIAQLILEWVATPMVAEVDYIDSIPSVTSTL